MVVPRKTHWIFGRQTGWSCSEFCNLPSEHNVLKHDGVADKRFKLIHFYGGENGDYDEFYDLRKDPQEMHNCIADHRYTRKIKRLQKQLDKFRVELKVDEY